MPTVILVRAATPAPLRKRPAQKPARPRQLTWAAESACAQFRFFAVGRRKTREDSGAARPSEVPLAPELLTSAKSARLWKAWAHGWPEVRRLFLRHACVDQAKQTDLERSSASRGVALVVPHR